MISVQSPQKSKRWAELHLRLMTDILENKRNLRQSHFCPQQIIVIVLQFRVSKVIPSASVPVQQRRRFDSLFSVLASLAFESVVGFTKGSLVKLEELSESIDGEVSFGVFFLIDDGG